MRFSYRRYEVLSSATVPAGVLYRPELPIRVVGRSGELTLLALADTGADETLLPRSVGESVGAVIDERRAWSVAGLGGPPVHVVAADLTFELVSRRTVHRWRAIVGLAEFLDPEDEVAVLGHVGFFDRFTAHFNTRRRQLTIRPNR